MQKAAAYLKNIREEKGYSIQEVSKNTKISPAVLRSLEEGRLENVDPVYLKGFLKMYCRFLGINWEDFLKEYPIAAPQAKHLHRPALGAQQKRERPASVSLQSSSVAAFVLKNKKIILIALSAIAGLLFMILFLRGCMIIIKKLPRIQPSVIQKSQKVPAAKSSPKQAKPTLVKEALTVKPLKPYPETSQATTAKTTVSQPKEPKTKDINLTIKAQEDSFLKIRIDGQMVYQGSLRKGKAESWTAKERIELSVGNAGGIVLEVNGKVLSPLGRRGQQIKNILINGEGLKIL